MSRDTKVGLVIVISFVFILGTILIHRLRLTSGAEPSSAEAAEGDSEGVGRSGEEVLITGESNDAAEQGPTAVEGLRADTMVPATGGPYTPPPSSSFTPPHYQTPPTSNRPPADLPKSSAQGAHISLDGTDPGRQPAAIREDTTALGGDTGSTRSEAPLSGIPPDHTTAPRTVPFLEIRSHTEGAKASESAHSTEELGTADELDQTRHEEEQPAGLKNSSTETRQEGNFRVKEESDLPDAPSAQGVQTSRLPPPRGLVDSNLEEEPVVRQVGEKRRGQTLGQEPATPPQLPKFRDPVQPTIEALSPKAEPRESGSTEPPASPPIRTAPSGAVAAPEYPQGEAKRYVVREGDSFWSISAKHYGTGKYFRALEHYNKHRLPVHDSDRGILRPGTELHLPDLATLRSRGSTPGRTEEVSANQELLRRPDAPTDAAARPARPGMRTPSDRGDLVTGGRTYRVQDGDTLSTIAQRELGSAKRWQELYQLNRDKLTDERSLRAGMELRMPADRGEEKLAERPYPGR